MRIKVLDDKCKLFQKCKDINDNCFGRVKELEKECDRLQTQVNWSMKSIKYIFPFKVSEMESFLADYGLVWVGEQNRDDYQASTNNDLWTNVDVSPGYFNAIKFIQFIRE